MVTDMRIETVRTGSFTMDYCRFGHGQTTLVILPGMSVQRVMNSANAIAQSYARLAEDFTFYVFERRNDMPEGYSVIGAGSIRVIDGILHVGLSSLNGRKPVVWKDGQIDSLNVNGFISSIWTESVNGSVFP